MRAFTVPDPQGDYNVYINKDLSAEQQKKSFEHEKRHIANGDFIKDIAASAIEKQYL